SGQADVGIDVPVDNIASSGLSFKKLSIMEFCAVAAPNHPLADMKTLTKERLQSYRQAMGMSQHGSRLPDSFKKAIRYGFWAGLPRNMVAEDLLSGKLVELPIKLAENELKGIFYYVWNPAHELTPAEQWLCENFGKKLRDAIS
ncbi:LysR family transcriptional regulator, partial [Aduncisulcus paluster]